MAFCSDMEEDPRFWLLYTVSTAEGLCYFPFLDAFATAEANKDKAVENNVDPSVSKQVKVFNNKVNNSFIGWVIGKKPINLASVKKTQLLKVPRRYSYHTMLKSSFLRIHFAIRRNVENIINWSRHRVEEDEKKRRADGKGPVSAGSYVLQREREKEDLEVQEQFAEYCQCVFDLVNLHKTNLQEILYPRIVRSYESNHLNQKLATSTDRRLADFIETNVVPAAETSIPVFDKFHELVRVASYPLVSSVMTSKRDYAQVLQLAKDIDQLLKPILENVEQLFAHDEREGVASTWMLSEVLSEQEIAILIQEELMYSCVRGSGTNMKVFMIVLDSLPTKEASDMHENLPWVVRAMYLQGWIKEFEPFAQFMKDDGVLS